jgi:Spy/CpxP family protein refolding chaperone
MKRVIVIAIFLTAGLFAQTKNSNLVIHDIVQVELPGALIKSGKLELNAEQKQQLMQNVKPIMHEQYNVKMQEAYMLERKIQRAIQKGTSIQEIEGDIEKLANMKKEATLLKITARNNLYSILNDKQRLMWKEFEKSKK